LKELEDALMAKRLTYEELEQTVKELERKTVKRRRKEEARSNDWFRALWECTPEFIYILNKTGRIIETNRAVVHRSGYSKKELVGKRLDELFTDGSKRVFEREFPLLLQRGTNRQEVEFVCKDRTIITMDCMSSVLRDKRGKTKAILAFQRDISERKRAEKALIQAHDELERQVEERTAALVQANEELRREIEERKQAQESLRQSEERFQQVAENAREWIWEVDGHGLYTYASPIVEEILGYKPEEVVGEKYFYDLFHPEDREELKKAASKVFTQKQPFGEFVNRNMHKDGKIVWLSTSGIPVLDEMGNLLGYRGADADITQHKLSEEELRERRNRIEHQAQRLEKVNTALKVLLDHREEEKKELEENILANVRRSIFPYIEKMETGKLSRENMTTCLHIIKSNLEDIVSPFVNTLSSKYLALTPTEIQIADLIKLGKTSKEIASLLNVSANAVWFHRNNIRKKLGISRQKANLGSYLQPLSR
jgi:PAS domain S-box-containing protein